MMYFNLQYSKVQLLIDNARRPCHSMTESAEQLPALCPYKPITGSYRSPRRRSRSANVAPPPPPAPQSHSPPPTICRWESSPSPRAARSTYRKRPEPLLSQMRPILRHLESSSSSRDSSSDDSYYYEPNRSPIQSAADHSPRLPTRRSSLRSSCDANNCSLQEDIAACKQAMTTTSAKLPAESTASGRRKHFSALAG